MKYKISFLVLLAFLSVIVLVGAKGQDIKGKENQFNKILMVDDFDKQPSGINCSPFHGETAIKSLGYIQRGRLW